MCYILSKTGTVIFRFTNWFLVLLFQWPWKRLFRLPYLSFFRLSISPVGKSLLWVNTRNSTSHRSIKWTHFLTTDSETEFHFLINILSKKSNKGKYSKVKSKKLKKELKKTRFFYKLDLTSFLNEEIFMNIPEYSPDISLKHLTR